MELSYPKAKTRIGLLWLAGVRFAVSVAAVPLAPFLYREHFILLVLMRPTKEVLLAAGFLIRQGRVSLPPVLLAAIPLMVLGVWLFFYLGRAYRKEIEACEVPGIGDRILSPDKIQRVQKVLDKRGPRLVYLGRLAALSSAAVATAAGAGRMGSRDFLTVDGLGALTSAGVSLGAGYMAGAAYERAGPWITAVGIAVLIGAAFLLARYLKRV